MQIYPHVEISHVDPKARIRGTRETEPRMRDGYHFRPNTEQRHKALTGEEIRLSHVIRAEAAKDKDEGGMCKLLPPLPCPYKICATCDSYRAFWKKALEDYKPHTISLF